MRDPKNDAAHQAMVAACITKDQMVADTQGRYDLLPMADLWRDGEVVADLCLSSPDGFASAIAGLRADKVVLVAEVFAREQPYTPDVELPTKGALQRDFEDRADTDVYEAIVVTEAKRLGEMRSISRRFSYDEDGGIHLVWGEVQAQPVAVAAEGLPSAMATGLERATLMRAELNVTGLESDLADDAVAKLLVKEHNMAVSLPRQGKQYEPEGD